MANSALSITKKERLSVIDWLIDYFPAAFFKKSHEVRPLKIGILNDILEFYDRLEAPTFSKKKIRDAVSFYSSSPAYLSNHKEGSARIDLFGNEVDVVTREQAHYALQRFQERYLAKHQKTKDDAQS